MNRRLAVTTLALCCTACDAHGVRIGSEALCGLDPLLVTAHQRNGQPELPDCASVGENRLVDGSFEAPLVGTCNNGHFCQFPASDVPGWDTSSELQQIEIWNDQNAGVAAQDGKQFVELDASTPDTVFQDLALLPGQLMYWSFFHRGRNGLESLELLLGSPDAPLSQGVLESPSDTWTTYSGLYQVGVDETITRFALASRTGTSEGNLVDAVVFAPVQAPVR